MAGAALSPEAQAQVMREKAEAEAAQVAASQDGHHAVLWRINLEEFNRRFRCASRLAPRLWRAKATPRDSRARVRAQRGARQHGSRRSGYTAEAPRCGTHRPGSGASRRCAGVRRASPPCSARAAWRCAA